MQLFYSSSFIKLISFEGLFTRSYYICCILVYIFIINASLFFIADF